MTECEHSFIPLQRSFTYQIQVCY
uniref:Uncharacterized protein n=1 Tax=Rhizophora mucronata TaxID=61149 RepID=A0A2P2R0W1_RHIMU